ncbi:MAG TPA: glycosyltransferase [bacterium]|nr:glycosyltransferase [bacterium]
MKIAQVVPVWFPVPPQKFGGLELVVANLIEGLQSSGHEVTLFGFPGNESVKSVVPGVEMPPLKIDWLKYKNIELENFVKAVIESDKFDLIHFHISSDLFPLMLARFASCPVVVTVHNFVPESLDNFIYKKYSTNLVLANKYSRSFFPDTIDITTVYHGIRLSDYGFSSEKEDYFVYLSRIEPMKGAAEAIAVAKELRKKLYILGPISPLHHEYFAKEIEPQIDNQTIFFQGEADLRLKKKYLSKARALIFPTKLPETFGLVAAEAMACGTPVIAYDSGAVSEVVLNGKTGFIAKTDDLGQLIKAAIKLESMSGDEYREMVRNCRSRVEQQFSLGRMTSDYLKVYERLAGIKYL